VNWESKLATQVSRPSSHIRSVWAVAAIATSLALSGPVTGPSIARAQNAGIPIAAKSDPALQRLLFTAVRNDNLNAVRSIVDAGADVTMRNSKGQTPFDLAISSGYFEVAQYLILARRLQQQQKVKTQAATTSAPAVTATIRQPSPEAAPEVVVEDRQPTVRPTVQTPVPVAARPAPEIVSEPPREDKTPATNAQSAEMKRLEGIAEKLAAAAEALAASQNQSRTTTSRNPAPQPEEAPSTVIVIGPDGKIQSTRKIKPGEAIIEAPARPGADEQWQDLRVDTNEQEIPRPGRKPVYAATRSVMEDQEPPEFVEERRVSAPNLSRLSPAEDVMTGTKPPEAVVPARRISPELREKLRRKLPPSRRRVTPRDQGTPVSAAPQSPGIQEVAVTRAEISQEPPQVTH
jgi:ankyrin repeat protein